jgi:TetR/AcrR family transcriptional repressor of nem operon
MTRERIVQAATALIAQHGVAGMNTEQVRDAAGVSGSQLYHYFDSKQALIRAVIVRQADEVGSQDSPLSLGALDSFEALRAWAEATLERQGERRCDLTTLAGELSGVDDSARAELSIGFRRWKTVLCHGLEGMQKAGVLKPEADLDELSDVLLTALHGGSQLALTLQRLDPMHAALRAALSYVESFAVAGMEPSTVWSAAPLHDIEGLRA